LHYSALLQAHGEDARCAGKKTKKRKTLPWEKTEKWYHLEKTISCLNKKLHSQLLMHRTFIMATLHRPPWRTCLAHFYYGLPLFFDTSLCFLIESSTAYVLRLPPAIYACGQERVLSEVGCVGRVAVRRVAVPLLTSARLRRRPPRSPSSNPRQPTSGGSP
jgi:hypothetical protein